MKRNNRFYHIERDEIVLEDRKIVDALRSARKDFEDGAIVECMDTIAEIYNALALFTKQEEAR